jgi:lipopolysaccharide/colanic/teichoic acid biosynthesis glycosyltransferase
MNQAEFNTDTQGSGWRFYREKASNFIKGLGAYFAIVFTNISLIIIITIVVRDHSLVIKGFFPYLYISILYIVCYSVATTKTVKVTILNKILHIIKRLFDVVMSALSIFILMPLLILIAIAIKLESAGPVLYRSKRIGQFGTLFDVYKFRTMYIEPKEKSITKVGNLLRRLSWNYLPMLFNVLNGELSLVGPRPRYPNKLDILDINNKILTVRPGMTGLWQISNKEPQQSDDIDLKYIENWSLLQDLKTITNTFFYVIFNKKT